MRRAVNGLRSKNAVALLKVSDDFLLPLCRTHHRDNHSFGDEMLKSPPDVALDNASFKHEAEIRLKQDVWLKKKNF